MNLILHAGSNKCGSSTIQYFIEQNIKGFAEQGFVVFDGKKISDPEEKKPTKKYHQYANEFIRENNMDQFESVLKSFIKSAESQGFHSVIISDENILVKKILDCGNNVHTALTRNFDDYKVLFYIRPQHELVLSLWQQNSHKLGWTLDKTINSPAFRHYNSFKQKVNYLEETYGEENLTVYPIPKARSESISLLEHFSKTIGIDTTGFDFSRNLSNPGLNLLVCDLLRRVPEIYNHDASNYEIKEIIRKLTDDDSLIYRKYPNFLSYEDRQEIMNYFRNDNKYLHEKYFDHLDFNEIFEIPSDETYPLESGNHNANLGMNYEESEMLKDALAIQYKMTLNLYSMLTERSKNQNRSGFFKKITRKVMSMMRINILV